MSFAPAHNQEITAMTKIPARRCASTRTLLQIKDVTPSDALRIREIWQTVRNRREARDMIDKILRTHGVAHLGYHKRKFQNVYYANGGDTYATTVLFIGPVLRVGCWGDLVERNLIVSSTFGRWN